MIKAVFRNGKIEPIEAIPSEWREDEELFVQSVGNPNISQESLDEWAADVKAATANISDEDHDAFMAAIAEIEFESKHGRRNAS